MAQLEHVQPLTGPVLCAWNAGGAWSKTRQDYTVQVLQAVARRLKNQVPLLEVCSKINSRPKACKYIVMLLI